MTTSSERRGAEEEGRGDELTGSVFCSCQQSSCLGALIPLEDQTSSDGSWAHHLQYPLQFLQHPHHEVRSLGGQEQD
jgi:hypothetical protein